MNETIIVVGLAMLFIIVWAKIIHATWKWLKKKGGRK